MNVYDTLRLAITAKQCVRVLANGRSRDLCPHALGTWGGKPRLLAFQYNGGSASGLAPGGQWRTFFLNEISMATVINGTWRIGPNPVAKIEAALDNVIYRAAV